MTITDANYCTTIASITVGTVVQCNRIYRNFPYTGSFEPSLGIFRQETALDDENWRKRSGATPTLNIQVPRGLLLEDRVQIVLFDLSGRRVINQSRSAEKVLSLEVADQIPDYYFLKVSNRTTVKHTKSSSRITRSDR